MKTLNRIAVGFLELRMQFSTTGQTDTNLIFLVWYLLERDVYSIVFIFFRKEGHIGLRVILVAIEESIYTLDFYF